MIISHKHKFIFFKTKKTAGTSIEIALSKYRGPDDVITPFCFERNPWDRIVSLFFWRCQQEPRPTISEFIN
jgi:hypothetical protein